MPVACNSPLRFGATALGQQEDMWLALLRPNFLPQTSHIPETLSEIRLGGFVGDKNFKIAKSYNA